MLGKRITDLRKRKGYSISQLAEKSNISKSYLSNLERDLNSNPSIQVLIKIAQVLQVNLATLIEPVDNRKTDRMLENEYLALMKEIKTSLNKEQIEQYKLLLDFIKWKKAKENHDKEFTKIGKFYE